MPIILALAYSDFFFSQCAYFAPIIIILNLEHRPAQTPREGLCSFCLDTKRTKKIKTARSFHPQASSRPGVQSGLCPLPSATPNNQSTSSVPAIFSGKISFRAISLRQSVNTQRFKKVAAPCDSFPWEGAERGLYAWLYVVPIFFV
ncbi:hypothetical protein Mucpa_4011 [Mucilaginibacter paludis DSM 18603]|uniref:Uncharacterized protein n=1 Tax=Mucilaginibacter paludis DSM 18603 TaxID=714943 RepID=H1Y4Q8_9SPHI|nr:hypothetical protein Mucpa_4011 [Mucilaginibacter paludis DSM 18603]